MPSGNDGSRLMRQPAQKVWPFTTTVAKALAPVSESWGTARAGFNSDPLLGKVADVVFPTEHNPVAESLRTLTDVGETGLNNFGNAVTQIQPDQPGYNWVDSLVQGSIVLDGIGIRDSAVTSPDVVKDATVGADRYSNANMPNGLAPPGRRPLILRDNPFRNDPIAGREAPQSTGGPRASGFRAFNEQFDAVNAADRDRILKHMTGGRLTPAQLANAFKVDRGRYGPIDAKVDYGVRQEDRVIGVRVDYRDRATRTAMGEAVHLLRHVDDSWRAQMAIDVNPQFQHAQRLGFKHFQRALTFYTDALGLTEIDGGATRLGAGIYARLGADFPIDSVGARRVLRARTGLDDAQLSHALTRGPGLTGLGTPHFVAETAKALFDDPQTSFIYYDPTSNGIVQFLPMSLNLRDPRVVKLLKDHRLLPSEQPSVLQRLWNWLNRPALERDPAH